MIFDYSWNDRSAEKMIRICSRSRSRGNSGCVRNGSTFSLHLKVQIRCWAATSPLHSESVQEPGDTPLYLQIPVRFIQSRLQANTIETYFQNSRRKSLSAGLSMASSTGLYSQLWSSIRTQVIPLRSCTATSESWQSHYSLGPALREQRAHQRYVIVVVAIATQLGHVRVEWLRVDDNTPQEKYTQQYELKFGMHVFWAFDSFTSSLLSINFY